MCADSQRCSHNNNNKKYNQNSHDDSRKKTQTEKQKKQWNEQCHHNRKHKLSVAGHKLTSGQKSAQKWSSSSANFLLRTSIILLLWHTSHVLALRKGRLMSPSSFTALSGDLHVQIQFTGKEVAEVGSGVGPTTVSGVTTVTTPSVIKAAGGDDVGGGSTITSTLVISKLIDDSDLQELELETAAGTNDTVRPATVATTTEQVLQRRRKEIVQNILLYPDPRHNVTQVAVPCQTFIRGGLYEMQVVTNLRTVGVAVVPEGDVNKISTSTKGATTGKNSIQTVIPTIVTTTLIPASDERLRQTLDVRWPSANMQVQPDKLRTYPENPVRVTLRFPEVNCEPALHSADLPEFWLELVYCGKERTCNQLQPQNISKSNVLYAEQVRGYPKEKVVVLGCELFGLAGNYAVQLRPMRDKPANVPTTRRFLSVDWSNKFVFNVYARSIFPCDPHTGVGVLYEYPGCILEQGDRVRVYAKLRADVASLKPPTSLHYVAEQRVVKNQYSLYFSCDLFTEKYVEYCFVYVSQAISGAVADVRMDCVPTLPVSDSDTGGWGLWSEWTPCSTNCLGGTRNRYRFCDSPPPRYGAKFCEGPSVETEKCGKSISNVWDCIYETSGETARPANRTDVYQEIGPGCRCGCIVHLGYSKPKRIIAGATQSCPQGSFWLIQVDGDEIIALTLNFWRLPCAAQYIKVRDGASLSSTLLIELNGGNNVHTPVQVRSSGVQLLVEFYAGEGPALAQQQLQPQPQPDQQNAYKSVLNDVNANAACTGGFLANVEQIVASNDSSTTETVLAASTKLSMGGRGVVQKAKMRYKFTLVHLSAVIFASIIILISALLGIQYVVRYQKYHLAVARRQDEGSRLHTPHASMNSLQCPPSRAISTTTLLSEVIYMVKIRPKHQLRHSILRESVDAENLASSMELSPAEGQADLAKCDEELGSTVSISTLRNETTPSFVGSLEHSPSANELVSPSSATENDLVSGDTLKRNQDSTKDTESIISSGMSSIYNSPPMQSKRFSKYSDRYDAVTLKLQTSRLDDSINDGDSLCSGLAQADYERLCRLNGRSASVSLSSGCYSPAASVISTSTIRTTNPKESKEKQNRRKLLARPGSEFSLSNQGELELDYYDYDVINAGAAPGSYLGMDPAQLIWIPPFDGYVRDDDKTPEPIMELEADVAELVPLYEEIKLPKHVHYLSTRSNTESSTNTTSNNTPTSEKISPLSSQQQSKATTPCEPQLRNNLLQRVGVSHSNGLSNGSRNSLLSSKKTRPAKLQSKSTLSLGSVQETIPLHELSGTKSARDIATRPDVLVHTKTTTLAMPAPLTQTTSITTAPTTSSEAMTGSYVEKETRVVKSPSDLHNFLALDDIQFADESETDLDVGLGVVHKSSSAERNDAIASNSFKDMSLKVVQQQNVVVGEKCAQLTV